MQKFWAVWRASGGAAPTKRHGTFQEAKAEAERLCRQAGELYYVLEVVGAVMVKDQPTDYVSLQENPF